MKKIFEAFLSGVALLSALVFFEPRCAVCADAPADAQDTEWRVVQEAGEKAQNENHPSEAEKKYRAALELAGRFAPQDPRLARSLNALAGICFVQGKLDETEKLFEHALDLCKKSAGTDSLRTAYSLESLAWFCLQRGGPVRIERAEQLYRRAVAIREKSETSAPANPPEKTDAPGSDASSSVDLARTLTGLGEALRREHKLEDAQPVLERAVDLWTKAFPGGHPDLAGLLIQLAQLQTQLERFDAAEATLRRALLADEANFGAEHPDAARDHAALGVLYTRQKKFTEADTEFRQALKIQTEALGAEHPETAVTASQWGLLYSAREKYREAASYFKRALKIFDGLPASMQGSYQEAQMETLSAYAEALRKLGKPDEAEKLEKRLTALNGPK